MKKLILLPLLSLFCACASNTTTQPKDAISVVESQTPSTTIDTTSVLPEKPVSNWEYSEQEDKMTSKKVYGAQLTANELLQFDFPYNGGSVATLYLRHRDNSNDILLSVSKGQFMNGVYGGDVRLRFDSDPPFTNSYSNPSDGSSNAIFLNNEKRLISKLKKSHKLLIEAEFYNEGRRQIEFDVEGLKWDH